MVMQKCQAEAEASSIQVLVSSGFRRLGNTPNWEVKPVEKPSKKTTPNNSSSVCQASNKKNSLYTQLLTTNK